VAAPFHKPASGRLVIYGAGGHGRELAFAARLDGRPTVFMADSPGGAAPLITREHLRPDDRICVAVGSPETRRILSERVLDHRFAMVIAPTAAIDPSAEIGEGAQICDFCFIGSNAIIGKHFQANVRSHVHHDCVIGDYVTLSPAAVCLGTVHIGDNVFIGAGAIVRNGSPGKPLTIGKDAVIGMGAVITKDVEAGATVMGNPAT
jgi:sugar O-acyltransferase (sialic acid O-acetyltransferase NeuD family)